MEDFTFNDLHIKLGFPYLYCHQGDCEHVVVITDIRYVTSFRIFYLEDVFLIKVSWGEEEDSCMRWLEWRGQGTMRKPRLAWPHVVLTVSSSNHTCQHLLFCLSNSAKV